MSENAGFETQADFDDGLLEAVNKGIEVDLDESGEPPAEQPPEPEGRPRNEKGQFVAQEGEAEAPAGLPPDALTELRNAQELIGRQGQELGALRQLVQEAGLLGAGQQPQGPTPPDARELAWFEAQTEENPYQAVEWARSRGDEMLYNQAIDAWYDVDPRQAGRYERMLENGQIYQNIMGTLQGAVGPLAVREQERSFGTTIRSLNERYPDFHSYADRIQGLLAENPHHAQALVSGDPALRERTLELAYKAVKADELMAQAQPPQPPPAYQPPQGREYETPPHLVPGGQTAATEPPQTAVEAFKNSLLAPSRTSLEAGLNWGKDKG